MLNRSPMVSFLALIIAVTASHSWASVIPMNSTKKIEKIHTQKPVTVRLETAIQVLEQSSSNPHRGGESALELLDESDPVVKAIDRDQDKIIRKWLVQGHSPLEQIQNKIKETVLERAAMKGSEKVFDLLVSELELSSTVDPKVWRDSRGTPILVEMASVAVPEKKSSIKYERMIERFLVDHSHLINDQDGAYIGDGRTALHQAAANGNARLIEILLSHGALVDSPNLNGETPLHFAARFGRVSSLKLLISHGARIDPKSKHTRSTPLLIAAENGQESIIRELLYSGAKKSEKDIFGKTAPQRYREYVSNYLRQKPSN